MTTDVFGIAVFDIGTGRSATTFVFVNAQTPSRNTTTLASMNSGSHAAAARQ